MKARRRSNPYSLFLASLGFTLVFATWTAEAGDATWNLNPSSSNWLTATNWTPATVPNAPGEIATFGLSNTTNITMSGSVKVGGIVFSPGASAYTIDAGTTSFLQDGGSIQNNSGISQSMIGTGLIYFDGGAGDSMAYTMTGGLIDFYDAASAGNSTYTINGNGTIYFQVQSSAGTSMITVNGGFATFDSHTHAEAATLVMNPGSLKFAGFVDGGTARVELLGSTSSMDVSAHALVPPTMTIGSIEGSGPVTLGSTALTVGSNNLSTTFAGPIQGAGMLIKTGKGKWTLSGASTYTGGTTVQKGTLLVANTTGSATGTGAVEVRNGGALGGTGLISGAVTVGADGTSAILAPGNTRPGNLTINGLLTFESLATYKVDFSSTKSKADQVTAMGVTILSGAQISLQDLNSGTLPSGTVLTLIRNTAATPTTGTFANLGDGATITVGANTFQASYEGGDGNDLTLIVVP